MDVERRGFRSKRNRLAQLQSFCQVARLESFARAAEHLGVSPPAISLRVRELEEELQARLFERVGAGVSLTLAGERLLRRVEPLVERMDALFENGSELISQKVSGRLELATSVAGAAYVLPPYVKRLRDRYPGVRLLVRKCGLSEALAMLLGADVELVLGARSCEPDRLLEYREVLSYDIVLITSLDHPLAGRETVTLNEAAGLPAIVPPAGSSGRQFGEAVARRHGIEICAVIEVGGWSVLKRYVENGLGVSVVPSVCIHETDQVSVIRFEGSFPRQSFGVYTRRGKDLSAPARQMLRLMTPDR